ncbi:MAG: carboxypeptidase regulatory-like domain-containing protein [Minicystis sp.]
MKFLDSIRLRTAITGKVIDAETQAPIPGARVSLSGPPAFQAILDVLAVQYGDAWAGMTARPDRAISVDDGFFQFGDVPDGAYTLTLDYPRSVDRYGTQTATTTVTHAPDGSVTPTPILVALPPTAVKGTILRSFPLASPAKPPAPLQMARVRVRGSGQEAYTDGLGNYYLTGVDPGQHVLAITSPGLAAASATVTVTRGVVTLLSTVTLSP